MRMKGTSFYFLQQEKLMAEFKEEVLPYMRGWVLFALEEVESL